MDIFKIDSQKIAYFPDRIGQWLEAGDDWEKLKKIYPIYMEVSPSSGCVHRCIFCALDYLDHKPGFLDFDRYVNFVKIASAKGVRSVMFGGEGEPLLHPKISEMVSETKKAGIDVAFTTNGSLMDERFLKKSLRHINWIKVSIDAGTAKTHALIHGTSEEDFENVLGNISRAVSLCNKNNYKCSIGAQILLLPQNYKEVLVLGKKMKEIGVDYFVVKPYSQGLYSKNKFKIDYKKFNYLEKQINRLADKKFNSVFRRQAFDRAVEREKKYQHCLATPFFWAYIMTNGDLYGCSVFLGNERFVLGNINKNGFDEIWEGERRRKNWQLIKKMTSEKCRENCRMDKVNLYLDGMKNPPPNHTFI